MKSLLSTLIPAIFAASFAVEPSAASGKRVSVATKSFEETDEGAATGKVTFAFSDETEINADVNSFSPEIQKRLAIHGLLQKGGDSYAGVKGNVAEAKANVQAILEQLTAGAWKGERGDAGPRLGELAEAIARIKSVPVEAARAAVEKADDDQRKTWRSNAKVKAVIAQLRSEAAAQALEKAGEEELNIEIA